ncbi:MAG: FAD-binding oxidoreductase [Anaerolineae bacterium]
MSHKFFTHPDQPAAADIIVIGGGPAGTAALWAIERAAPGTRTVLLEQADRLGAGSSTASLENYRTCWPAIPMMKQMKRCVEVLHHADAFLGEGAAQSIHVKQRGYLFCAFNEQQAEGLRRDVQRLQSIGLAHIEYFERDEVARRYPWLGERVIAAKYDPIAGWLDSNALIYQFAKAAPSAQIVLSVPQVSITVHSGRVIGVKTPAGEIAAPNVIIASGANARKVGRTAGVELPLVMRPRQSVTTGQRHPEFPDDAPMIIGSAPHPHVRPEAGTGAIFGWEYAWNNKRARNLGHDVGDAPADALIDPIFPLAPLKDPRFPSMAALLLARQFGHADGEGFAHPNYMRGLHHNIGYYVSRDHTVAIRPDGTPYESERALIDAVPGVDGLYASVAHVGHGVMTSPAAGEIIASKVLGLPLTDPDFAAFGYDALYVEYDEAVL